MKTSIILITLNPFIMKNYALLILLFVNLLPAGLFSQVNNDDKINYEFRLHELEWLHNQDEIDSDRDVIDGWGEPAWKFKWRSDSPYNSPCPSTVDDYIRESNKNDWQLCHYSEGYHPDRVDEKMAGGKEMSADEKIYFYYLAWINWDLSHTNNELCSFDRVWNHEDGYFHCSPGLEGKVKKGKPSQWNPSIADLGASKAYFRTSWRYSAGTKNNPLDFGELKAGEPEKTHINANRASPASYNSDLGYTNDWPSISRSPNVTYKFEISSSSKEVKIRKNFPETSDNISIFLVDQSEKILTKMVEADEIEIIKTLCPGTYYAVVASYPTTGDFKLSISVKNADSNSPVACAAPENDLCENAIALTCPFADWLDTTDEATAAGMEGLTFCDNNTVLNAGVWFRLEGNDKSIELSTDNPNTTFDTRLSVYAGSCGNLSCVATNDNFQEGKYTSRLEFYAKTGTTYFIYLDGKDGAMGNYLLSLFCSDGQPPLPAQNCADTTASYLLFEDDGKSRLYTRSFDGFALGDSPRVDDEFYTSSDNIRGWSWDGSTASYVAVENGKSILYTRSFDGNAFASGDLKRFILTENDNVRAWSWDGNTASYILYNDNDQKSYLYAQAFNGTDFISARTPVEAFYTSSDNIRGWSWDGSTASYVVVENGESILYTRSFDGTTFGQPKRTVLMENENVRGWSWHIDEFDAPCNETSFELTFKVDLSAESPSPQGVFLAGGFQKLAGYPKDWDPTSIRMDDSDGDGVYTKTIEVTGAEAGRIFSYKFINGTQWEGVPAECGLDDGNGTYNRSLQLPTDGTTSLEVSHCFSSCETTCNSIIEPAEGPDYIVSSFEFINGADPDYIEPGKTFKIEAKIKNVGNRAFDEQTRAFYYLSKDETLDDFDLYLTRDHIKALGSNDINTDQEYLTIPANTAEGDYFLIYRADAMAEIAETNEENNLRFIPIYVGGRDEVLCDDFENYAPGGIAEQLASDHWVKWSNNSRDGEATSSRASDGGNSLKIQRDPASSDSRQPDVLLKLGNRNRGTYYLSWKMYVPAGKTAYFNMQENQDNPGSSKFRIIFNAQSVAELRVGSNFREQYDYPQNQWFDMSVLYDMDEDKVIVSLNGDRYALRSNWRLGAIDFYAIENAEFYVDEFCMIDLNAAQNVQRQAIAKSGRETTEVLIDVQASKDLASIKKSSAGLDTNASLGQNYPNPVEYQTTIPYDAPMGASEMQIRIVSSAGRLIEIIPLQEKGKGKAIFDASRLNEGVFFYSLFLDGRLIDTKRMVKVK